MTPITAHRIQQAPALIRALRASYGIAASPSQGARAARLAAHAYLVRPGVYQVGECQVDTWRGSCSCITARAAILAGITMRARPCVHWLALYLAGQWSPADLDPCAYLRASGVTPPEILAVYARYNGGLYRITHTHTDTQAGRTWACAVPLNGGVGRYVPAQDLRRLQVMYV